MAVSKLFRFALTIERANKVTKGLTLCRVDISPSMVLTLDKYCPENMRYYYTGASMKSDPSRFSGLENLFTHSQDIALSNRIGSVKPYIFSGSL